MSTSESIRYGIDLGTTNSSIALMVGDRVEVVRNKFNHETTPSVVSFWREGGQIQIEVGQLARQMVLRDGARVAAEFKQNMGDASVMFEGLDVREAPHQLSARVVRDLCANVKRQAGLPPVHAALITVPAAFKNPARDDTQRAGEAAGLAYVELFPEPCAAALAYGRQADTGHSPIWLAFDLGGGTFDAALVRAQEGVFTVLDSEGDRHLGGKNLDEAIITTLVMPRLPDGLRQRVIRGGLEWRKLKFAAEEAKIALSTQEEAASQVEIFGTHIDMALRRDEVEPLQAKTFERTLKICRDLLARNGFERRHIERVILVGGPLLSPGLRSMVREGWRPRGTLAGIEGLGIDIDHSVDPMTAVAQGAAIRAAAQRIPASCLATFGARAVSNASSEVSLTLSVSNQVLDEDVLVAGQVEWLRPDSAARREVVVIVERLDSVGSVLWQSAAVPVSNEGKFLVRVALEPGLNQFHARVLDADRRAVDAEQGRFDVLRGIASGELNLSRGFGVADENGNTVWFFRKGDALNQSVTKPFATTVALERGKSTEAVVIPVVEGFEKRASLNAEVYTLRISSETESVNVPVGAIVDVTLRIDLSQKLEVTAKFKDYTVQAVSRRVSLAPDAARVRERLTTIQQDLELFRRVKKYSNAVAAVVEDIESGELIEEVKELIDLGSNENSAPWDKAAERELEIARVLDIRRGEVDELLAWDTHKAWCDGNIAAEKRIIAETADLPLTLLAEFESLFRQYDDACSARDRVMTERIAFRLVIDLFLSNDQLREHVGRDTLGPGSAAKTSGAEHKGTIRQV